MHKADSTPTPHAAGSTARFGEFQLKELTHGRWALSAVDSLNLWACTCVKKALMKQGICVNLMSFDIAADAALMAVYYYNKKDK